MCHWSTPSTTSGFGYYLVKFGLISPEKALENYFNDFASVADEYGDESFRYVVTQRATELHMNDLLARIEEFYEDAVY